MGNLVIDAGEDWSAFEEDLCARLAVMNCFSNVGGGLARRRPLSRFLAPAAAGDRGNSTAVLLCTGLLQPCDLGPQIHFKASLHVPARSARAAAAAAADAADDAVNPPLTPEEQAAREGADDEEIMPRLVSASESEDDN